MSSRSCCSQFDPMAKRKSYQEEAEKLAKAIDIAIEAFQSHMPKNWEKQHIDHTVSVYKGYKNEVLNPEPQLKSMASLMILESDVFTYFQESSGETVNFFWKRIEETNLNYQRTNKLDKILKRGSIRGTVEYDYVKDIIATAEQEGLTTPDQTIQLSQMLDEFERK